MNPKNHLIRAICMVTLMLFAGMNPKSNAQNSNEPKQITATYLLQNAHITTRPGQTSFGSILMKDGLIVQVGPNILAPFDAQVIDLDSMYVYAGFIDALSHVGLKKAEKEERPKIDDAGNPPNNLAGITPEHSVYDDFAPTESSVSKLREAGFGIAHVVPDGRMLPGMGAIFSLADGTPEQLVIKKEASMFSQLKSASGMAPGTTIGVMAKYRDIYRNAEATNKYGSKYTMNPVGMRRAQADPAVEAFIPVVNKSLPVYFIANNGLDISRVIQLQKDLGFKLVISDVEQGWTMLPKIKLGGYPILLSMKLPDEIKEDNKDDKDDNKELTPEEKVEADKKAMEAEQEKMKKEAKLSRLEKMNIEAKKNKEERKKLSVKNYESQAGIMEKEGIPFAFTTISAKAADIQKNLRRMVAAGLSEKMALAAITTQAADQLGISKIAGTIDAGKIANLVITDQPYFEEKSTIRYVFVDGQMNEYKKKEDKKASVAEGEGAAIVGNWKYTVEVPGQSRGGAIKISMDGDQVKIELSSDDSPGNFEEATAVTLSDDKLTFNLSIQDSGMTMDLSFDFKVMGDSMEGNMTVGQFGTFPITATKTPN